MGGWEVYPHAIPFHAGLTNKGNPPVSKARREAANLTERKNPHAPVYGVEEFVCLSVCYQIQPQLS